MTSQGIAPLLIAAMSLTGCAQTVSGFSYWRADGVAVPQQAVQADLYACTKENTTVENGTDTGLVNQCMQAKGYAFRTENRP